MLSSINSTLATIWKKFSRKAYRDSFVGAHISNTVASQIALLREKHGWTQKALAEKTGMKQSRISALENPDYENIEVKTLRRLASAFDVALVVRFAPFSEVAKWSVSFSPEDMEVSSFDHDSIAAPVNISTGDGLIWVKGMVQQQLTTTEPIRDCLVTPQQAVTLTH